MKRLSVVSHLAAAEARERYRTCSDPREKTRWHLIWLLLETTPARSCEQAGPLVGLSDTQARAILKRWNAEGPDGLRDGRTTNKSIGKLSDEQQTQTADALQGEPPDGGLWSGPKLARYVRDRWGIEVCPETGWRWLKKLGFRLVVPRPRHPKAADPDEQRRWL